MAPHFGQTILRRIEHFLRPAADEENLNISATTQGEERPIHYFSGGQKTRINMALRVAISRILSKLPSTKEHTLATMNTLFIDEGDFGDLDDHGIRDAVEVIRGLTAEFSRVILISHVDTIKDILQDPRAVTSFSTTRLRSPSIETDRPARSPQSCEQDHMLVPRLRTDHDHVILRLHSLDEFTNLVLLRLFKGSQSLSLRHRYSRPVSSSCVP
jgi:hypothetical protein